MNQLRFLISRIDRIGDVVLSTHIPREIKNKYPDSFVAVLVKNYTKDIYFNNPYVDEIITFDNPDKSEKKFLDIVREIRGFNFTHSFMLLPNEKLNYILFFSGIKIRIGVGHKLYQFVTFTKYVNRKKYIPLRHEADYCADMLRKSGIEVKSISPEIYLTESENVKLQNFRKQNLQNKKILIGINVSSGNSAPNLNIEEYKKLILMLKENQSYKVAVMDNRIPATIDNIDEIIYPNRDNKLRESIVNFAALDLLISNSTGPMHICAALKIPTVSLFCPLTACSPKLWGPIGNKSEIILPSQTYCATQCPIDPKKCDYSKTGGLRADFIFERINTLLLNLRLI
ncbi:MAG TPA: ADP-heptose--LPS heptosyltransferase [Ignavibacteriales bacterium]|nr:ADP-heptose--LPS heptosyltransferase [Ignavibacteriales bacterium]